MHLSKQILQAAARGSSVWMALLFTRVLVHFVLAEFESRIEPKPKIPAGSQRETLDV